METTLEWDWDDNTASTSEYKKPTLHAKIFICADGPVTITLTEGDTTLSCPMGPHILNALVKARPLTPEVRVEGTAADMGVIALAIERAVDKVGLKMLAASGERAKV